MKVLVNVGRLAGQKNQSLLLHMLQRVTNCFLLLVGEGELRRELFAEAAILGVAGRVKFTGELEPDRVVAVLRQSDIFLLPSEYESFSLAAVEAMHYGVPVIATDLPCLREVLGDSQLFFPFNDLADLTRKVQYLLSHKGKCARMGAAGRARADRFTVPRMVGEYECLLAEAAIYAHPHKSATNNLGRFDSLGSVPRIHHHP